MAATSGISVVRVRRAVEEDAAALAALAVQLGYPCEPREAEERLLALLPPTDHAVFVAETPEGAIAGWLHVSLSRLIESPLRAEVNGLIVDGTKRSLGAGKQMLEVAERWARERGCQNVNLRSNVLRERAHAFYLREGYEHYKTQKAFRKKL
ncbi:MAG: GNAT family N-acetyltransferase [Acidobacteriia bacterium]|nr:GNAT family N-acetyltransferase [Terriglobia bacterium]